MSEHRDRGRGHGMALVVAASLLSGVLAGVGTLVTASAEPLAARVAFQPGDGQAPPTAQQQAALYWQDQDWEHAAEAYGKLAEQQTDVGQFAFRHAYALHALGRYEEALSAHERASRFPQFRPVALYNMACAAARLGRTGEAFASLDRALNAGFRQQGQAVGDPDLTSLHDDPRWAKYVEALGVLDHGHALAFWLGTWEVRNADGGVVGHNVITSEQNGNVIREEWTDANGRGGTSINFFDWRSGLWRQVWVDGGGGLVDMAGGPREDGSVVLEGERAVGPSVVTRTRTTFTVLEDGRVRQYIETSADEGRTWRAGFDGYYTRVGDPRGGDGAGEESRVRGTDAIGNGFTAAE